MSILEAGLTEANSLVLGPALAGALMTPEELDRADAADESFEQGATMISTQRIRIAQLVVLLAAICGVTDPTSVEAQESKPKKRVDLLVGETEIITRAAVCRWAAEPPVLDGKLDDRCWQRGAVIDRFGSFWTEPPKSRPGTFAYLVWDDDALYYAGEMTDAELRSFGTKRNDHLWNGDVFELFLKPSAERPEYYEFQANPRGVVFEAAFPKRGHDFGGFAKAPVLGSKAVVGLKGTLDRQGDRDEGWSVEGRIPWTAFAPSGGKPRPGAVWLFAICRYDYGKEGTDPVTMSSAPLTKSSFHRYEDYGKLRFEGAGEETRRVRKR